MRVASIFESSKQLPCLSVEINITGANPAKSQELAHWNSPNQMIRVMTRGLKQCVCCSRFSESAGGYSVANYRNFEIQKRDF